MNKSDIVISIRYNNVMRIRQSKIGRKDYLYARTESYITDRIKELMEELEKEVKDLTTEVIEIDDDKQKAIDIGRDILNLIDVRAQEKVDEIRLCRG